MTLHSAGRQDDGSIIDIYGNKITQEEALKIVTAVNSLPAQLEKDNFLHALRDSNVLIVQGETGSGKSTQLPKFAHFANPNQRVVATQPRVLSATSLAERVSMEILSATGDTRYSLGGRIGYRTGRGKNASAETRLSYHTDGTEFMRQSMSGIIPDILFIDEAHGFSIQTEMLAMMARHHERAMKIVIMSATLDPQIFRDYYSHISRDIPLIQIPGRTFGVQANFDTESEMMEDLAAAILQNQNVLLFSPGKKEIQKQIEAIKLRFGNTVEVFPLHAEMPASEQNKLLTKTSSKPRIIVATNIAEESITIPYIDIVIDLGTQKVMRYNAYGTPTLGVENVALSSAIQRKGRGGRTKPGFYNRYNSTSSEELPKYPEAPIERERIDREILTLLSQGVNIIDKIYDDEKKGKSPFFHHVDMGLFDLSLRRLRAIGALTPENTLTVLGHELLKFPVDVYHARMLYESIEKGCIGNIIDLVSILEKKGFVSKDGGWQDLLSLDQYSSDLDAYRELLTLVTSNEISNKKYKNLIAIGIDPDELRDFQDRNGEVKLYEIVDLSPIGIKNKKVKEIDECREALLSRCASMGIDIVFSTDTRAQLISLATGYNHNKYIYNEELGKFISPEQGEYADRFKQGDISVIEPRHKGQYIGSPFIVRSSGVGSDLNILTHIISVNSSVLSEAVVSNIRYSKDEYIPPKVNIGKRRISHDLDYIRVPTEAPIEATEAPIEAIEKTDDEKDVGVAMPKRKTIRSVTKVLQGGIVLQYESAINEFHITRHASSQDAQHFYLKYCLVPFLFQSNPHVQKYITGRDQEWLQFFAEILKRFLGEHDLYRIDPANITKTEGSFRHDSGIIDRIKESMDPTIRDFRLHGIPKLSTRTFLEVPTEEELVVDNRQSSELVALKNQYAALLGQANQYIRHIPLTTIEDLALIKTVTDINEGKGSPKAVQAYIDMEIIMQTLQTYTFEEVQKLSSSVKGIGAKRKELHKYEVMKAKIIDTQKILSSFSVNSPDNMLSYDIDTKHFGHMSEDDIIKYKIFIDRVTSSDTRKRKRVLNNQKSGLEFYQSLIEKELSRVENKISSLTGEISLEGNPIAKSILSHLAIFVNEIFREDYRKLIVDAKLYDIMRRILRDNITEKKGLCALLYFGMGQEQMGQHMQGVASIFNELVIHDDNQYILDEYKEGGAIYKAIVEANDIQEVEIYLSKLNALVNNLKKSASKVDSNKLWLMYRNNGK